MNWILEADIQSFFDSVDRAVLGEALQVRVADGALRRLIGKCLYVGVLDGAPSRVWGQSKPPQPFAQHARYALGVLSAFEPQDDVIAIAEEYGLPPQPWLHRTLEPEIEPVMPDRGRHFVVDSPR